jgi:hypothetical protein
VLYEVAFRTSVSIASIRSRRRPRQVTFARRVAVVAAVVYLGRRLSEIAPHVGISAAAAGQLARSADEPCHELAQQVARQVASKLGSWGGEALKKRCNSNWLRPLRLCNMKK